MNKQVLTVFSMYLGYACFMILKTAPVAVSPALIDDPSMGVDEVYWGKILAVATIGGILGKFLTGWMADRFGGKFTFVVGLLATSLAVALFAISPGAWFCGFAYFVAVLAKASGWPSMAKLIGNWFRPTQFGRVWGIISTSSRVGTIAATLLLGALLAAISWRWVLIVSAGLGGLFVFYCIFTLREHPATRPESSTTRSPSETEPERNAHALDGTTLSEALRHFFTSRRFWCITGSLMGLTILWDFINWMPQYLKTTLDIDPSGASMLTTAFPLGSFVSVLAGGYVFDKLDRGRMALVMGALLVIASACILTLYLMPSWGLQADGLIVLTAVDLFVFGLCVSPCYYLPMSVFSIEFGGPHSGFLIALLDALAFSASAVFSWFGGDLIDAGGWTLFLGVLLSVSAWSAVTMFAFLRGEARAAAIPQ
ncbi:MAG: MFS transporter [Planctomycetes bacterium]|nr:MFS transporter [Planctomycetota bacterium]